MQITNINTFASEASSSGLGALGVDVRAFVIQLITFVLVLLVLKKYAFKPIVKILNERRDLIESGVKLGEEMQKEHAALEAKVDKTLHEARQQADAVIASAQEDAKQAIKDSEDKAREKAKGILDAADSRIVQDTARARKQLESELVNLISDATEAIIDEKVDSKKDSALIERALKARV